MLEYHRIAACGRWTRTAKQFRQDLEQLYNLGYRPVTISEIARGEIDIPPGASPVAITFDDGDVSQYRILPNGEVDPDRAIGVWIDFAAEHPDFPIKATFYVLPKIPFGQRAWVGTKLRNLEQWGSEIGSHTMTHRSLGALSDDEVKREIVESIHWLESLGVKATSIAVPFGMRPKNHELLRGFMWNGRRYELEAAVRVGARPARSPYDKRFDPHDIWRILGEDGELRMSHWLERARKCEVTLYVQP